MKQTLLSIIFGFTLVTAAAQFGHGGMDFFDNSPSWETSFDHGDDADPKITIFPNPASHYISINNGDNVKKVVIYNLVGRQVKSFEAIEGSKYNIMDLNKGMYLVQLLDSNSKIIT